MKRYKAFICDSARWEGFEQRAGDIVVTTPPKCGTTWMQMCCLLLVHGAPLPKPLGELSLWLDQELKPLDEVRRVLDAQQHRRVIKTHTPVDGLPWRDDVTYVGMARDPRDVALSMVNHLGNMDVEAAARARVAAGNPAMTPRLGAPPDVRTGFLGWVTDESPVEEFRSTLPFTIHHLRQLWQRRDDPNVLLFHYADLRVDLAGQLRRLADGLGIDVDEERLATLAAAASFDAMKDDADNLAPNAGIGLWHDNRRFFAEGRLGGWRDAVDDDALATYDERVAALCDDPALVAWLHR